MVANIPNLSTPVIRGHKDSERLLQCQIYLALQEPIVDLDECSNVVSISPIMIGEIDDIESDDPKTGAHSS